MTVGVVLGLTPVGAPSSARASGASAPSALALPSRSPLVVAVVPEAPIYAAGSTGAGQYRPSVSSGVLADAAPAPWARPILTRADTPTCAARDVSCVRAARAPPPRAG